MNRKICALSLVGIGVLYGCREEPFVTELLDYPEMVFTSQWIEFGEADQGEEVTRSFTIQNSGELALGISAIYEGAGHADSFSVSYDSSSVTCPEGAAGEGEATAKDIDTADGGEDTSDTGEAGEVEKEAEVILLGEDCKLPVYVTFNPAHVGKSYGAVIVETATQLEGEDDPGIGDPTADADGDGFTAKIDCDDNDPSVGMAPAGESCDGEASTTTFEPAYFSDPDQTKAIVYLEGDGLLGKGISVVQPRFVDFGHLWTGEEEVQYIEVTNGGDGDLVLSTPQLSGNCDEAFSVSWSYEDGSVLEGGASNLVEVTFVPTDQSGAYCTLQIVTDDPENPSITATLQGNAGVDPENEAPTVVLHSPSVGYQHMGAEPLRIEMNIFDVNQPATSLLCKVKSIFLVGASVANCTPTEESGHVVVELDVNDFDAGVDTILIQVTDASEVTAYASFSVLIRTDYPPSDDDGDGYGDDPNEVNFDCDDTSASVYPRAAEVYDGIDNDCDFLIDEGTIGFDDDGDTFSEVEGDCNDLDDNSYPGAPEMPDHADNNCNGIVDEGTDLFDDDGDGFAEVNNDCDDTNPAINPGALEFCDGIDNDCNGLTDKLDNCIEINTKPIIVGGIEMARTACEEREVVALSMFVYDADGQQPNYSWSVTEGGGEIDDPTGRDVNWTSPELPRGSDGQLFSVYAVAVDDHGNQVWDFDEIAVYPVGGLNDRQFVRITVTEQTGLCSSTTRTPAAFLGLLGLGLVFFRRRRA
jgi:MYXO-CTERM domain-containing protein